jgi:hypothetical protein
VTDQQNLDLAALQQREATAQQAFAEHATVSAAESVVGSARMEELAALQKKAARRHSAAKGLLTKAQKDGSADKIAAARARVDAAWREYDDIAEAGLNEMFEISNALNAQTTTSFGLMREHWNAMDQVADATWRKPR